MFIAVLALAASALAATDREREWAAWIASHDQNVFGLGTVGFDVSEMPWSRETFDADRAFFLRAIAAAEAETRWDRLGYAPRPDRVRDVLGGFRVLIEAFTVGHLRAGEVQEWGYDRPDTWEVCPVHRAYLSAHGCVLCHDQ